MSEQPPEELKKLVEAYISQLKNMFGGNLPPIGMIMQTHGVNCGCGGHLAHEGDPKKFPFYQEISDSTALVLIGEAEELRRQKFELETKVEILENELEAAKGKIFLRLREISGRRDGNVGYRDSDGKWWMVGWDAHTH